MVAGDDPLRGTALKLGLVTGTGEVARLSQMDLNAYVQARLKARVNRVRRSPESCESSRTAP